MFARTWTPPPKLRDIERDPQKLSRPANYGSAVLKAAPKTQAYRDPVLLEMARGRPCLLCVPGECCCRPGSVVACHSNSAIHGKAKSRKADDCYSVWGGDFAHEWLDRSGATRAKKESAFMAAHLLQVLAWREIAADPSEPERFRKAAQRALERMNATPPT
jgi:hypothetical protein